MKVRYPLPPWLLTVLRGIGLVSMTVGALVMVGHLFGVPILRTLLPGLSPVAANMGLGIVLAGGALACLVSPRSGVVLSLGYVLAAAVTGLAGVSLMEYLAPSGWDVDRLVFGPEGSGPVRMPELAALVLLQVGGALLLLRARRLHWAGELLASFAAMTCLLSLTWECFRPWLPTPANPSPRLVVSSVVLLLLALSILAARPDRGWVALVLGETPGSLLARRLLPVAVLSPPVFFWCYQALVVVGAIKPVYLGVLYFVSIMLVFAGVVLWYAAVLNRLDARRNEAEGELRRNERRLRALIENSHDVIVLLSADGTILYVSASVVRMLGFRPEELVGRNYLDLLPSQEVELVRLAAVTDGGPARVISEEHRIRHKHGPWRWVEVTRTDLLSDPSISANVLNLRDITERQKYDEALRESEERYRDLVENANDVIYTHDLLGNITSWNRAAERLTGYTAADVAGLNIAQLVAPEHLELAHGMMAKKLADGGRTVYELDVLAKDGRRLTIEISSRLANLPGQPTQVQGVARDTTERKLVERTMREADRKKDEFLALLAHELRNPLAPLRNGLQVMKLAPDDARAVAAARAMMDRQLGHMVRLIDDLLDVSRISRNKLELQRAPVALTDVVAGAVETARPAIDDAGHEFTVHLPAETVLLDADMTRLGQVFSNLLSNSAKYTNPGGHIWLEAQVDGNEVIIAVRDDGIGIPAESLPHIFDMFSQVDRSIERKAGGLGIGLALVKGLVEMHGGTITAASAGIDRGCTFTVRLPVVRVVKEAPLLSLAKEPSHHFLSLPQRVLVVDDNRDSAESMAIMLTMLGNEVRTAHDGLEAVEAAERYRPDVILMDIGMPRLNGLDATRQIRSRAWGPATTIVALTGWGQDADRDRSHEAGCDAHLVKPVSMNDLDKVLHDLKPGRHGRTKSGIAVVAR